MHNPWSRFRFKVLPWGTFLGLIALVLLANSAQAEEPPIVGRINLTFDQYTAATKELQTREYRPISLCVYRVKRENLHAAIWMRAGQIPWQERYNRTLQEYQADAKTLQDDELRPISLHVQTVEGKPRFTLIWKKLESEIYYFRDHVKPADLRKFSTDYAQRDIYPVSICGFDVRGEPQFGVIWEKTRPGSVEYQIGLSEAAFQKQTTDFRAKGFLPKYIAGYMARGKLQLAAIWTQESEIVVDAYPSLTESDWEKQSAAHDKAGFDLQCLQATVIAGKPRFSAVWRRVKDPPQEPESEKPEALQKKESR